VWKVGDEGRSVAGKVVVAAYGASRLSMKCTRACGQRSRTARAIAPERANSPMP
jgi:hypothetical protein